MNLERKFSVHYGDLKRIAQYCIRQAGAAAFEYEPQGLIHEAYLRMSSGNLSFADHDHFSACFITAIHRFLGDEARRRHAIKRGGGIQASRVDAASFQVSDGRMDADVLALRAALARLALLRPDLAQLVYLRYWRGCTKPEAAALLNISLASVTRWQRLAESTLRSHLDSRF